MSKRTVGNGEGSLFYSKSLHKWIFQYYVGNTRKSLKQMKNETVRDFRLRVTKIKNEMNNGVYIAKSKETIISILEKHINNKYTDGVISDRSYKRELETLKQIEKTCSNFCYKPIQNVTITDIENSKENIKKYSNSVISKIWEELNKAFYIANSPSRHILSINIMQDIEMKKPLSIKKTKKLKSLTALEEKKIISILDNEERNHKFRNIVKMQLISGMRIGEVLSRTINDFDSNSMTFRVHDTVTLDKNGRLILGLHTKTFNKTTQIDDGERFLPIDSSIFCELQEIIKEQSNNKLTNLGHFLFWNYKSNTFVNPSSINSWLYRLNKKYNICNDNLSSHILRHTALTRWQHKNKISKPVIQYLAGHVEGSKITELVYIDTSLEHVKNELKNIV